MKWLAGLGEIFPGSLYIKLEKHAGAGETSLDKLARLARQAGIPCTASHNIYYIEKNQSEQQRLLASIRLNKPLRLINPSDLPPPEAHFLTAAEMEQRFFHHPQALLTASEIAERCSLKLPLGEVKFPEIDLPKGLPPIQVLRQKAEKGARHKYGEITAEINDRLDHEIGVIDELGFAPLFLIMERVIEFARSKGIPTASRGFGFIVAGCPLPGDNRPGSDPPEFVLRTLFKPRPPDAPRYRYRPVLQPPG